MARDTEGRRVAEPEGVTFHTFRHSMASNALNAGIAEHIVQRMGNWKDRRMVSRYGHLGDDALRDAEARVARLFAGVTSQSRHNRREGVGGKRVRGRKLS